MADTDKRQRKNLTLDAVIAMIGEPISSGGENDVGYSTNLEDNSNCNIEELMFPSISLEACVVESLQAAADKTTAVESQSSCEEADDSDRDADYQPEDDLHSESETDDRDESTDTKQGENSEVMKHVRKKRPATATWKQNNCKKTRLCGMPYTNKKGKAVAEKKMGVPCQSTFCWKSQDRNCQAIDEDERSKIFKYFWSMNSWDERKIFVQALVEKVDIKQKKAGVTSRRQSSFAYKLKLTDGSVRQVCKSMFCSTFGISQRTIMSWLIDNKDRPKKCGPKTGKCARLTDNGINFLSHWLQGLPTVDSHYCRSTPAYKEKKFLHPGTTISQLHREYKQAAEAIGMRSVSVAHFSKVFHEKKYSVFIPRKDQCDVCVSYKHGNIDKDKYDAHIALKDEARAEKTRDKNSNDPAISVWTMDFQAVLLCPNTKASTMYYKTKLQVHNFTFYDLKTRDGFCYIWNETEGGLASDIFAYLQFQHFEKLILAKPELKEIIIWSDGCGYQNRNVNVANAFSALAMKYGITITQKFLVAGHTQMECDIMHSKIEQRMTNDIFTERDYLVIIENARLRPSPYKVKQMKYSDFQKMDGSRFTSIIPGKRAGDPMVHDISGLTYIANGRVRLAFSETTEWEDLPQRIQETSIEWKALYQRPRPITERKFNDLQSMKPVIPADCHPFFDNLTHE